MPLHVQGQVVRPGEGPLTHPALERTVPGVLAGVPRQLIRPCKPPAAALEITNIWLLSRVRPLMGLQMAGLGVGLHATFVRTMMHNLLALRPGSLPFWLCPLCCCLLSCCTCGSSTCGKGDITCQTCGSSGELMCGSRVGVGKG